MSHTTTTQPRSTIVDDALGTTSFRPWWRWLLTALAFPVAGEIAHLVAGRVDSVSAAVRRRCRHRRRDRRRPVGAAAPPRRQRRLDPGDRRRARRRSRRRRRTRLLPHRHLVARPHGRDLRTRRRHRPRRHCSATPGACSAGAPPPPRCGPSAGPSPPPAASTSTSSSWCSAPTARSRSTFLQSIIIDSFVPAKAVPS